MRRRRRIGKLSLLKFIFWIVCFCVNFFWVSVKVLCFLLKTLFNILKEGLYDFIKFFVQSTKPKNHTPGNSEKKIEQYMHKDNNDKHLSLAYHSMDFSFENKLDSTEKAIKKNTAYDIHPEQKLITLFKNKPFQGQHPELASVLILGNDANYSSQIISHGTFFEKILEYHIDGVGFWQKYGVHHPFLLPSYPFDKRKDGVLYHRNFARLGLTEEHATKISFIELLDVPTIGITNSNKDAFRTMLTHSHLKWIENILTTGIPKIVLLNASFFSELKWLQNNFSCFAAFPLDMAPLTTYRVNDSLTLFKGYSFSATQFPSSVGIVTNALEPYLK